MTIKRVSAWEAKRLADEEGYALVDVRSMPEYAEEHAAGATNVPFLHKTPNGMIPNQDFVRVIEFLFPDRAQPIVTHCQMGGRGVRAAAELESLGYTRVVDMEGGFGGEVDEQGQVIHPGWKGAQLPVESGEPDRRSYKAVALRMNAEETDDEEESASPETPSPPASPDGLNRFASSTRTVHCFKYGRELPGIKRRPYPGELGQRIFDQISAAAWDDWVEHSKMIINEYRINASDPNSVQVLMEQCEQFLFGGAPVNRPEGYVPESS
ncbi:MAG: oxidative damage protection protein [Myxococcota bacterium]